MIHFENVHKSFGDFKVLDGLDLHIPKGKITFLLGKSGEGKSVTIKHIMGLLKPDYGKIIVDGQDLALLSQRELKLYRRKFGMLFQMAALFDSLSVLENISFPLVEYFQLSKSECLDRTRKILKEVDLLHTINKLPSELSTGEKKRIGLARALVTKPKILLYDEPTTGFDPLICEMIDELIVKMNQKNKDLTSVVISHDLKAALATAEHIVMIYKGKVILAGSPSKFKASEDPYVRQFFSGKVSGPMEFL